MSDTHITGTKYCIFRVGEKYKTLKSIKGFEGHMERTFNTPNAALEKRNNNKILIGDKEIYDNVVNYIEGIKLRKNGVIARDILLTASPAFFKELDQPSIDNWININIKFLKDNFGDNIRYAVVHLDELTPHIHCLIVPKFQDEKRNICKLRNNVYFDGKEKLSKWQDKYAEFITNVYYDLKRGTKGSKATHVKIKQYYTLVNSKLDNKNIKSVLAKASNSELLEKKIKALQSTLDVYKDRYIKSDKQAIMSRDKLIKLETNLEELKKDKEIYKETIKALSETYYISQEAIIKIVRSIENDIKKDRDLFK